MERDCGRRDGPARDTQEEFGGGEGSCVRVVDFLICLRGSAEGADSGFLNGLRKPACVHPRHEMTDLVLSGLP
jgi:hypothetical protein